MIPFIRGKVKEMRRDSAKKRDFFTYKIKSHLPRARRVAWGRKNQTFSALVSQ
jgi:hypothetical protein